VKASAGVRPLDAIDASYVATIALPCAAPPPPPPNRAPVASAGPAQSAAPGDIVAFDGSGSRDPDGQALSYQWTFGDGSAPATGVGAHHAYGAAGVYVVTLTVNDGALSGTATTTVTVAEPPRDGGSFEDRFDRPDSTALGSGWIAVQGAAGIQGQRLATSATAGDHLVIAAAIEGSTQQASAQFASPDNNTVPRFGLVLRFQDSRNYYVLYRLVGGTSVLRISRVAGGTETVLKQVNVKNPVRNAPFQLSAHADGPFLTLELEGTRVAVSDTAFSGGAVGLLLGSRLKTSLSADDFSAAAN
jgi:PKD domain-containing protein